MSGNDPHRSRGSWHMPMLSLLRRRAPVIYGADQQFGSIATDDDMAGALCLETTHPSQLHHLTRLFASVGVVTCGYAHVDAQWVGIVPRSSNVR